MTEYPKGMTLRPLTSWPRDYTEARRRAPFSATWTTTVGQLDLELWNLGEHGRNAPSVLQVAIDESKFRRDGMPRADATPEHPAVILNVESRHGPLSYPCDTFTRWQDNLRAIALSLEALRKINRYGVTQTGEQYRGWLAIESAAPSMTADQAISALLQEAGLSPLEPVPVADAYRKARHATHPDRNNGWRDGWDRVEAAAEVLRAAGLL